MDAVELPFPAAITASKLMGTGGISGVGLTVEEVEVACGSERILAVSSIESCSSLLSKKAFCKKRPDAEFQGHGNQSSHIQGEDIPKDHSYSNMNTSISVTINTDVKQLPRKSAKVPRSNGVSSKRLKMAPVEVSLNGPITDDMKEKNQSAKQLNNSDAKRGDKRNGKVSKNKIDSFSLKNGLLSISSSAGGSITLGVYGSNTDNFDVIKHENELLLDELLDGSYKYPSSTNGKLKEAGNSSETILHSVRKACSVLFQKPLQPQNIPEVVSVCEEKGLSSPVCSSSALVNKNDDDNRDAYDTDVTLLVKDFVSKPTPPHVFDFPLCQPKDILERLALPVSKDLDTLLMDSTRHMSRSPSDLRSKPVAHRVGLPPFPWSHTSAGHLKSNADAVKLSTTRSMCHGRWVKVGNNLSFPGATCGSLLDLETLAYDHNLIPSEVLKPGLPENVPPSAIQITTYEQDLQSSSKGSTSWIPPEMKHSPSVVAAAQALCEIATLSLKENPNGGSTQRMKHPPQRALELCKLSREKSGKVSPASKESTKPNDLARALPSKKPRFSVNEEIDDLGPVNGNRKAIINWPISRPNRPSPSRSSRDWAEAKNTVPSSLKRPHVVSPPLKGADKGCERQKLRKLHPIEWSRATYSKLDS